MRAQETRSDANVAGIMLASKTDSVALALFVVGITASAGAVVSA